MEEVKVRLKSAASRDSHKSVFLDIVPLVGHVMLNKHRDVTIIHRHEPVVDMVKEPGY